MDKKHLVDRIVSVSDLAAEPIPGRTLIEIVDDSSVLIENYCSVILYCPDCISVRTKHGCVAVIGSGLVLARMAMDQLKIIGKIHRVDLQGMQ